MNEPLFCTKQCTKGCFCKPGYVKDTAKKCILPQNCPIGPCSVNEVTANCVNPCNTCMQRGKCYLEFCSRGCDCRAGFFRNSTGHCIDAKRCDVLESVCPPNEHYVHCVNFCNDCWSRGDCDQPYCHPGCDCNPGYFRDDNGDCILERYCFASGFYCGVNEEYSDCVVPCNDCQSRGNCKYTCEYGCDCKRGYYRNSKGVCVHAVLCLEVCRENEEFHECGPACQVSCATFPQADVPCLIPCVRGCFCKPGFIRSPDGRCILPTQCPVVCGKNEELRDCGTPCPLTCTNVSISQSCPKDCVQGCFCKPGFVRGPDGSCILPTFCPPVCRENEEFHECGPACQVSCVTFPQAAVPCPIPCVQGCFCKTGFIRSSDGRCILPTQCPVVCGKNEEFQECGTSCPATCSNRTTKLTCPAICRRGCFCKDDYVRGPDNKCILSRLCPIDPCIIENEEFRECGPSCIKTCARIEARNHCALTCTRGCFCKDGFVRDILSNCIKPTDCPREPQRCPVNEKFYACMPTCGRTCDTLQPGSSLPCDKTCRPGCFCKEFLVRRRDGKCIPPRNCPGTGGAIGRNRGGDFDDIESTSKSEENGTTVTVSINDDGSETSLPPTTAFKQTTPRITNTKEENDVGTEKVGITHGKPETPPPETTKTPSSGKSETTPPGKPQSTLPGKLEVTPPTKSTTILPVKLEAPPARKLKTTPSGKPLTTTPEKSVTTTSGTLVTITTGKPATSTLGNLVTKARTELLPMIPTTLMTTPGKPVPTFTESVTTTPGK